VEVLVAPYDPVEVLVPPDVTGGAKLAGTFEVPELDVADPPGESVPSVVSAPPSAPAPSAVESPDPIRMAEPSN
jgi:hypothetical protein